MIKIFRMLCINSALEQGTAELPDFRGVSTGQRTVRAERRRQLAQLNNPERDGEASGPYRRDSAGDAGRDRRLRKRILIMARIIYRGHLNKDHPIFSGRFIFTSHTKPKPENEPDTSEPKGKEEDQS